MSITLRELGKNGPKVSPIGLGLMGLSHQVYGAISSDEERFKFLDRAHELGQRFWDSADLYGDSEELLGKWFKRTGKRGDIFLATKFGFVKGGKYEVDSSAEYCKKACDESLRALGVEYIDLYYMHHANPKTPIEETMRALAELKAEGKIKYIGLSAVSSATLHRAEKIAHVDAVQLDYSPFNLEVEKEKGTHLLDTCRELGVAVVAAMPLGRGMVTSNFADDAVGKTADGTDVRHSTMPRFSEENRRTNIKIVQQFRDLATKHGCTTSQLALAWLLKQGDDVIPIPGTKRIKYLEENWEARTIQLSDADEKEIRGFLEAAEVAGNTLPPAFENFNYTNTAEES